MYFVLDEYVKYLKLMVFIVFMVASTEGRAEPFQEYEPSYFDIDYRVSAEGLKLVPKGNLGMLYIPLLDAFTVGRLALDGYLPLKSIRMNLMRPVLVLEATDEERTALIVDLGEQRIPLIMRKLHEMKVLPIIVRIAEKFKMDPLHILGPILGENAFNGSIDRTIQDLYSEMVSGLNISTMSGRMAELELNQKFQADCKDLKVSNYGKWRCLVFENTSRNTNRELLYIYQFKGSGTFGLGQMQPYLMWSYNDLVHHKMKYPLFKMSDMGPPMKIIFDKEQSIAYIAACSLTAIHVYRRVAGVDISQNPGLVTSLYNLGDENTRAYYYYQARLQNPEKFPEVNYMGWFINHFEKKIRQELKKYVH